MSMATSTVPVGLESFGGELVGPGHAAYDDVRRVHNGLIDKRPAMIARCPTTPDVVDAVRYAGPSDWRLQCGAAATTWRGMPSLRVA